MVHNLLANRCNRHGWLTAIDTATLKTGATLLALGQHVNPPLFVS